MNWNEKEPTPPSDQEHSIYVELRRRQAEFGTIQKYVSTLQKHFDGSEDYKANTLQFRRMAKLIVTPEEVRHDSTTTNEVAGFYVGELLGLNVSETLTNNAVADDIYRSISQSYYDAQADNDKNMSQSHKGQVIGINNHPLSVIGRNTVVADYLLGELEAEDGSLDLSEPEQNLIEQWARDLAPDDHKIQECIIHGFAFVRHAMGRHDAQSTSDIDKEQIDMAFAALTDAIDFEIQAPTLESCAELRAELLGQLDYYLETFEDENYADEFEFEDTLDVINAEIKRDFERLPGLELNDDVVAYGDSFIIIHDPEASPVDRYQLLSNSVHAKGKVGDIAVMMIPNHASMERLIDTQSRHVSTEQPEDDKVYGLMLRIDDVAFLSNSASMTLPERVSVFVPLNYRRLTLMRIKYS